MTCAICVSVVSRKEFSGGVTCVGGASRGGVTFLWKCNTI